VCVVLFTVGLWLPAVQRATRVFPKSALAGVESNAPRPEWSWAAWFSGEYARQYESRYNERIGLRGPLVRTYNQVYYSIFRKIPGRRGTQIVRGQDHWLYEKEYIKHVRRPGKTSPAYMEPVIKNLRRLQDALDQRGVGLVVVISPSKPAIYPEHLPPDILAQPLVSEAETDYGKTIGLLDRYGIRCVDGHRLFKTIKAQAPYPLFTQGGTHWSHYGAFVVVREILKTLRDATGKPVPVPEMESAALRRPEGADNDLGQLLNVWHYPGASTPAPYPQLVVPGVAFTRRPRLLLIGDSFVFTLLDVLRTAKLSGDCSLLYYYKRLFNYAAANRESDHGNIPSRPIRREDINWERDILSYDAIILEVNEISITKIGWGFIDEALRHLESLAPTGPEPAMSTTRGGRETGS